MSNYLIFDTETSGLPPLKKVGSRTEIASPNRYLSYWDSCRLVEIAWCIYNKEGERIKTFQSIVQPNNFTISSESERIHGISMEQALQEGRPIQEILHELINDLKNVDTLVAHNIEFDHKVILSELIRNDCPTEDWIYKEKKCTMKDFLEPFQKWPKLTELYERCFQKKLQQSHRALEDANACAEIFFHLNSSKLIN